MNMKYMPLSAHLRPPWSTASVPSDWSHPKNSSMKLPSSVAFADACVDADADADSAAH